MTLTDEIQDRSPSLREHGQVKFNAAFVDSLGGASAYVHESVKAFTGWVALERVGEEVHEQNLYVAFVDVLSMPLSTLHVQRNMLASKRHEQ